MSGQSDLTLRWVVLKFGGTSVASAERWDTSASLLQGYVESGYRPLAVCSALSGVSNLLQELGDSAEDERRAEALITTIEEKHRGLADAMRIDNIDPVLEIIEELRTICTGARMLGETSARFRARLMSSGELMSTRLGTAFLCSRGIKTALVDARECLRAVEIPGGSPIGAAYLAAECHYDRDLALIAKLGNLDADVLVTQGFIATNDAGETVLLGRGGSDTSAAYFAASLGAERLEIWTDVPGIFTTNPHRTDEARMLRKAGYGETLTMASLGAKVLHPRCVTPARDSGIPLHLRSTLHPELDGTVVTDDDAVTRTVKTVTYRKGLAMIEVHREAQWQEVGVLADLTECFRRRGLSVDLMSSSPATTRLTLDPAAAPLVDQHLEHLAEDLGELGEVTLHRDVGTVSVVGSGVLEMLHDLAPGLERVEEFDILFVSHGGDGSHVSFVLPGDQVERFADQLHSSVFVGSARADLGESWAQLQARLETEDPKTASAA